MVCVSLMFIAALLPRGLAGNLPQDGAPTFADGLDESDEEYLEVEPGRFLRGLFERRGDVAAFFATQERLSSIPVEHFHSTSRSQHHSSTAPAAPSEASRASSSSFWRHAALVVDIEGVVHGSIVETVTGPDLQRIEEAWESPRSSSSAPPSLCDSLSMPDLT